MRVQQVWTTCWDALAAGAEGNLAQTLVGRFDQEADPVATAPEVGGDILAQGRVVPILVEGGPSIDKYCTSRRA